MQKQKKKILATVLTTMMIIVSAITANAADTGSATDVTPFSSNKATSKVYMIVGDDAKLNLSATIPIKVVLAVKNNGDIVGPTNYQIANTGSVVFHVTGISAALVSPYTFNTTKGNNTLNFTLTPKLSGATAVKMTSGDLALKGSDWNCNSNSNLIMGFTGDVGYISSDLTSEKEIFSLVYTIANGMSTT